MPREIRVVVNEENDAGCDAVLVMRATAAVRSEQTSFLAAFFFNQLDPRSCYSLYRGSCMCIRVSRPSAAAAFRVESDSELSTIGVCRYRIAPASKLSVQATKTSYELSVPATTRTR